MALAVCTMFMREGERFPLKIECGAQQRSRWMCTRTVT